MEVPTEEDMAGRCCQTMQQHYVIQTKQSIVTSIGKTTTLQQRYIF